MLSRPVHLDSRSVWSSAEDATVARPWSRAQMKSGLRGNGWTLSSHGVRGYLALRCLLLLTFDSVLRIGREPRGFSAR